MKLSKEDKIAVGVSAVLVGTAAVMVAFGWADEPPPEKPRCKEEIVIVQYGQLLDCDLIKGQHLIVVNSPVGQCLDTGGVPVSNLCVDVDF